MKYELIVCCRLTPLQEEIYTKLIKRKKREIDILEGMDSEGAKGLTFIINLKKLCNHPQLIYKMCKEKQPGFEGLLVHFRFINQYYKF